VLSGLHFVKMRPSTQQYSELPVEEKLEFAPVLAPRKSRWSKMIVALVASLLLVSLIILGISVVRTGETIIEGSVSEPTEADHAEWLAHAVKSRATGDQYLLGVGKADITGYVAENSNE